MLNEISLCNTHTHCKTNLQSEDVAQQEDDSRECEEREDEGTSGQTSTREDPLRSPMVSFRVVFLGRHGGCGGSGVCQAQTIHRRYRLKTGSTGLKCSRIVSEPE